MIRGFFRFIFSALYWVCTLLGFSIIAIVLVLYFIHGGLFTSSIKPLEKESVLSLTLKGHYLEHADSEGVESLFLGKNASLYDLTRTIYKAAQDEKIKGLVVRIESPRLGIAQIQELRDALLTFRQSGKPSWCYADTFGAMSSGTYLYYLATACENIWLQPIGSINLTGINIEVPFGKEALEKLDVKPEIVQRKEYKSFPEMYTRNDFSEASKEELQAIVDSVLSQLVDGIAKEQKIPHDDARHLIANGPYSTQMALTHKLVNHIDYRQNLTLAIRKKLGQDINFIGIGAYLQTLSSEVKGDKIALIFGSGPIQHDLGSSALDELVIGSDATYKAFQLAIEDKDVKAIVYRINSPGGEPSPSETIYSIINYAKENAKKPVIISMSDTAASGAYWISVAGTKIVAQPATLTGSIGVFGGKFVLSGLFSKLGVKFNHVSTSENSTMWSFNEAFTPAQWIQMNEMMDHVYHAFTSRVAEKRKMTPEQVEKVARGRVWTGEQALALGLVDQLGGLHTALDLAKKEAGLPMEACVEIYPQRKTFLEALLSLLKSEKNDSLHEVGILETMIQPFKKIMAVFTLFFSSQGILYAPLGEIK